jgi:O-antigen ligase
MTTSIFERSLVAPAAASLEKAEPAKLAARPAGAIHTMASRFLFLTLCVTVVLSTLAYGTVHYWALAVFVLGAALVALLWIADAWRLRALRISRNSLQWPLLGMVILGFVQLLPLRSAGDAAGWPISRSLSLDPQATRMVMVQVTALLVYFGAVLVFIDSSHRLRLLVRTISIFGFLLAIFGLASASTPTRVYWVRELTQSTAFGPFINRHHFAGYMELTLAVPLGLLFSGAVRREKAVLYLFAAAMMGVALILTNSRGGIISLAAELFFLVLVAGLGGKRMHGQGRKERARRAMMRTALAIALVSVLIGGAMLLGGASGLNRLVGTANAEDPSTGRTHFWSVTLDIVKSHPLLGTGLGAFGVAYTRYDSRNGLLRVEQAHNDYLQTLSDGGIVGVALALFFVVNLFRLGFARRESHDDFRRGVATGALAGCFAVLVHSFFDFTLHTTANALLFLVMAALATLDGRVERHSRRRLRRSLPVPPEGQPNREFEELARASGP